eukprot:scaffold1803_cov320-Prasinococcus_capsulatus_cf.AAC.1
MSISGNWSLVLAQASMRCHTSAASEDSAGASRSMLAGAAATAYTSMLGPAAAVGGAGTRIIARGAAVSLARLEPTLVALCASATATGGAAGGAVKEEACKLRCTCRTCSSGAGSGTAGT